MAGPDDRDRSERALLKATEADGNADQAHLRIDSHEELCAQRWGKIETELTRMRAALEKKESEDDRRWDKEELERETRHVENQKRLRAIEDAMTGAKSIWWLLGIAGTVCMAVGAVLGPFLIRGLLSLFRAL